jgi:hypothetical protein
MARSDTWQWYPTPSNDAVLTVSLDFRITFHPDGSDGHRRIVHLMDDFACTIPVPEANLSERPLGAAFLRAIADALEAGSPPTAATTTNADD